ncbi:MAG: PKD domain-containing protein [Vicinamibacteraceae bacterium]
MSSYRMSAHAFGLAAALAVTSPPLLAEPPAPQAAESDKPKKLSIDLRITPVVSFAPSRIRAIAELKLPDERTAEFYCATIEWDWGDLTESEESNECEPYEAGVSNVKRVFSAEHTFHSGGRYRVQLRLKRNRKVLASSSTTVTVRPGVRDAPLEQ